MMTYEEAVQYGDRLAQMFVYVKQEVELGRSEDDVIAELRELDLAAVEAASQEARDNGKTDEEIEAFWAELRDFGDADPMEDIDSSDPDYEARLAAEDGEMSLTQPIPPGQSSKPEEVV